MMVQTEETVVLISQRDSYGTFTEKPRRRLRSPVLALTVAVGLCVVLCVTTFSVHDATVEFEVQELAELSHHSQSDAAQEAATSDFEERDQLEEEADDAKDEAHSLSEEVHANAKALRDTQARQHTLASVAHTLEHESQLESHVVGELDTDLAAQKARETMDVKQASEALAAAKLAKHRLTELEAEVALSRKEELAAVHSAPQELKEGTAAAEQASSLLASSKDLEDQANNLEAEEPALRASARNAETLAAESKQLAQGQLEALKAKTMKAASLLSREHQAELDQKTARISLAADKKVAHMDQLVAVTTFQQADKLKKDGNPNASVASQLAGKRLVDSSHRSEDAEKLKQQISGYDKQISMYQHLAKTATDKAEKSKAIAEQLVAAAHTNAKNAQLASAALAKNKAAQAKLLGQSDVDFDTGHSDILEAKKAQKASKLDAKRADMLAAKYHAATADLAAEQKKEVKASSLGAQKKANAELLRKHVKTELAAEKKAKVSAAQLAKEAQLDEVVSSSLKKKIAAQKALNHALSQQIEDVSHTKKAAAELSEATEGAGNAEHQLSQFEEAVADSNEKKRQSQIV